jgi:biopolymer transport protein ExbB/TolQ
MTTRPQSVRAHHQRVARRSVFGGVSSVALLVAGLAVVLVTQAWWSWAILLLGIAAVTTFFGFLPRYRAARAQLRHVERIQDEQSRAAEAQRQALHRGMQAPTIRSPYASRA